MRPKSPVFLLLLFPLTGLAQYANSWINHSQTYYRLSVARDGIYRVTYQDLQEAGLPVNSVDPRLIQLLHRGTEQAIFFKHDQLPADAKFDPGEYFEFYGTRNDGTLDRKLYVPQSSQPHPHYNLFSDTTAYFLTWNLLPVQGKRMELFDQVNSTGLPKESYHLADSLVVYATEYSGGEVFEGFIQQSFFDRGEGWTGTTICTVNSGCTGQQDFLLRLNGTMQSGPPPALEIQITGRDRLDHFVEVHAGPNAGNLRLVGSLTFQNFETPVMNATLAWSDLAPDGSLVVRVSAIGVGGARERVSVSYIRVRFARDFNMAGIDESHLLLNVAAGGKSYIELDDPEPGMRLWDITDRDNILMIGTRTNGPVTSAIVPNTSAPRKLFATTIARSVGASQIRKASFRPIHASATYIIISHQKLMLPGLEYGNPVKAFAEFRASPEGGGYDTLVVTSDQLYNQFNYGEISPGAIYEFMRFMVGVGAPQYLFLVGKGREVAQGFHRKAPAPGELLDLVPTAGAPASDMVFTSSLGSNPFVPAVATGRLTASTPEQVAIYLNKVKESESAPFDDLWRKKILHLSGGIRANELSLFRNYMTGFEEIAEGTYLGGEVVTLGKHDATAIEFINISEEVNKGLSLVTFFGHSSSNATDIDIGYVSEPLWGYNNTGRYPAMLVNGCNAGEFFNNATNFGEDWIMTAGKGATNFMANSSFGFDGLLRFYTSLFYEVAFADSIFLGKGIGEVQAEVARRMLSAVTSPASIYVAQAHQMVLLGDPALRLFPAAHPDFAAIGGAVAVTAFDNKPVHALTDSLQLSLPVRNLGRAASSPMHVRIFHTVGEASFQYDSIFQSVLFQDTLKFTLRRGAGTFFGNNAIDILLDPLDSIEELSEQNNTASWVKFVAFNGTKNLQPPDFSIVSTTEVGLVFQDTDLLSPQKSYVLELDTTLLFNSPFLKTSTVQSKVLGRSSFTLAPVDSTVYYWRTRIQGQPQDQWETTSFTYINGSPEGWAQLDFEQIMENSLVGLVSDASGQELSFEPTSVSVFVKTFGSESATPSINGSFQVDGAEHYFSPQGFNCRDNTINLVAFDRSTVVPYLGVPFTFENSGGRACGREPQLINSFTAAETDTGNDDDLVKFVDNMKPGDSVILFSMGDAGIASWPATVRQKLEEVGIGGTSLDALIPGEPVIIRAKKGAPPGSASILRSGQPSPEEQEVQLGDTLTGHLSSGHIQSVTIGPSLQWKKVFPSVTEIGPSDETGVDLVGIGENGGEVLLQPDVDGAIDISHIPAAEFPFLRLIYRARDQVELSPARLRQWMVTFDTAPDGLIVLEGSPEPVTLREGESWRGDFGFVNISTKPFPDSVTVDTEVFTKQALLSEQKSFKVRGPSAGDTTRFAMDVNTRSKPGINDVKVRVNRNITTEQYLENNFLDLVAHLDVLSDRVSPILDVTVDGRYLVNGDYVSANPLIVVRVIDDNPIIFLTDTTSASILLKYPCEAEDCPARRINFSDDEIRWFPATATNEFRIEFTPVDLAAGLYTLYVSASDASGNPSGREPYEVNFEVSSETGVTFFPPYPNPSASAFFFEFRASGSAPPSNFQLQIFNREGKKVADFDDGDQSPFHVGLNRLRWPATDETGNTLSDGIYFYRLMVGETGNHFETHGKLAIHR